MPFLSLNFASKSADKHFVVRVSAVDALRRRREQNFQALSHASHHRRDFPRWDDDFFLNEISRVGNLRVRPVNRVADHLDFILRRARRHPDELFDVGNFVFYQSGGIGKVFRRRREMLGNFSELNRNLFSLLADVIDFRQQRLDLFFDAADRSDYFVDDKGDRNQSNRHHNKTNRNND